MPGQSVRTLSPLKVIIGSEDVTGYLSDSGTTFSNVDPGGFEACSMQFPKDLPQTLRGQHIRFDSGLHVAWEGRVGQVQRSLGHQTTITGQGYGALFADNEGSMVFCDRDLTKWVDPSYSRQIALLAVKYQLTSGQVAADPTSKTPALVHSIQDSWATPYEPINESWYDSGPQNLIAEVYYNVATDEGLTSADWTEQVILSSDANGSTIEGSGNLHPSGAGYFTPATAYRFAALDHFYNATNSGVQGATYNAYWHQLAAYGNHGLTGRGSDPVGFYPSDIFSWTLSQVPGLQAGAIQATDASNYIVPHSVYYTPVTLDSIVGDMATAQGWHWGVWDSLSPLTGNATPRADFRPRPLPGAFTASCRRQDCDTLDIREDLSQQYNRCVVSFTDVAGVAGVAVVTVDNPILDQADIPSRTVVFSAGTMDAATAAVFGAEALTILIAQQRVAGTADIIAPIDTGVGYAPGYLLKAGIDRLRVLDLPSTDAWGSMNDVPITRVECSLSSSGITASVEVGAGSNLVETLQARVAASSALAAQGGA